MIMLYLITYISQSRILKIDRYYFLRFNDVKNRAKQREKKKKKTGKMHAESS